MNLIKEENYKRTPKSTFFIYVLKKHFLITIMKLERILFFLATLYCFVVLTSSYEDNGRLTDYFSSFTHIPFTNEPVTRYYNLKLKETTAAPDGFERSTLTADDLQPGPILNKGDRMVVKVDNNLGEPTGIHWHGMFQLTTSWFDGAPGFVSLLNNSNHLLFIVSWLIN